MSLGGDWGDPEESKDAEDAVRRLRLDPDGPPIFCAIHGRKGCGKSEFLRSYASSWPYDAVIVDPTRDLDPDGRFTVPWPGGDVWPAEEETDDELTEQERQRRRRFRVVPDRNDPDHRTKVDRIVHLAHDNPAPTFIGIDEGRYLFASDERIEPGSDIVQNEGRHGKDFLFVANPRAVGLRPVFHAQADWIVVFDVANEEDLKRIAAPAGLRHEELAELIRNLDAEELGARGEIVTGFILIDVPRRSVTVYPILPLR